MYSLLGILIFIRIFLGIIFVKYEKVENILVDDTITLDTLKNYSGYQTVKDVLNLINMSNTLK